MPDSLLSLWVHTISFVTQCIPPLNLADHEIPGALLNALVFVLGSSSWLFLAGFCSLTGTDNLAS